MKYTDVSEKIQHQLDKIKSIESRYKAHKGSCVEQVRFLLAKHRKSLGVTLTEVSKKIKMCPSAAWQIENGNMAITPRVINIYMNLKAPKKVDPRSKGYGSRSESKKKAGKTPFHYSTPTTDANIDNRIDDWSSHSKARGVSLVNWLGVSREDYATWFQANKLPTKTAKKKADKTSVKAKRADVILYPRPQVTFTRKATA